MTDTSETYIKMCEKAEEIQTNHEYKKGDIVAYLRSKDYKKFAWAFETKPFGTFEGEPQVEMYYEEHYFDEKLIEHCWLPRQDQLQEMIHGLQVNSHIPRKQVAALWQWIAETAPKPDDSMEQLWLAFVMKEKYNKVWDGEDWVKR